MNEAMNAAEALRAARTSGIDVRIDGDDLALEAPPPPPAELLELLAHHKPGIVALLRPGRDGWSAEDWQAHFDERAGVAGCDGGLPRPEAEARAFECCVVEWLNRNFERSPPGRCLACGVGDHAHDALLPHGIEPTGHVWLHSRCWPGWHAGRKAEAVAALKTMGITPPAEFPDDFGKNGGG
jgi:hypothetical protein